MVELIGDDQPTPSLFFSQRTDDPAAIHPFESRFDPNGLRPGEISIMPGRAQPGIMRWDYRTEERRIDEVADTIVKALCTSNAL